MNTYSERKRDFYFIVQGKPLNLSDDESKVALLHDQSTVFVQYRNRGGCFMFSFTILMTILAAIVGSTCTCGLSLLIVPLLLPLLFILPFFCL